MFLASKHSASHGTGSLYFFNHKADSAEQMRRQSCKFPKNDDLPKIAENDKPRNPICPQATNPGVKDLSSHLFFFASDEKEGKRRIVKIETRATLCLVW